RKNVHSHAEPLLFKSEADLAQIEDAAVHRTASALGSVEAGTKPLEVGSVAPVYLHLQQRSRSQLQRVLRPALDRFGKILRRGLPDRQIDARQMLAIQLIKLGIIRRAVLGSVPPAPVAALRSQQGLPGLRQSFLTRRVRQPLLRRGR